MSFRLLVRLKPRHLESCKLGNVSAFIQRMLVTSVLQTYPYINIVPLKMFRITKITSRCPTFDNNICKLTVYYFKPGTIHMPDSGMDFSLLLHHMIRFPFHIPAFILKILDKFCHHSSLRSPMNLNEKVNSN
jgi:hypothetical protein